MSFAIGAKQQPLLVIDRIDQSEAISKNFRCNLSPKLRASASGQFSAKELQRILQELPAQPAQIWIVDLRQESHGFMQGIAISWYSDKNQANLDKTPAQILATEHELLEQLRQQPEVKVYHLQKMPDGVIEPGDPVIMDPTKVQSEQQLVEAAGAQYQRLFVLDHHRPDNATVDAFVSFVHTRVQPKDWLHFHCRGGKGRSSTFIAMYDMLENAKCDSFTTIMQRQVEMGNKDLASLVDCQGKKWKQAAVEERYQFLQKFYVYAVEGYPHSSWNEWVRANL